MAFLVLGGLGAICFLPDDFVQRFTDHLPMQGSGAGSTREVAGTPPRSRRERRSRGRPDIVGSPPSQGAASASSPGPYRPAAHGSPLRPHCRHRASRPSSSARLRLCSTSYQAGISTQASSCTQHHATCSLGLQLVSSPTTSPSRWRIGRRESLAGTARGRDLSSRSITRAAARPSPGGVLKATHDHHRPTSHLPSGQVRRGCQLVRDGDHGRVHHPTVGVR